MLDTQIYIDMMLSRKQGSQPKTFDDLFKLLEYHQIKLIVPNIVKIEVMRNLEGEIRQIGNMLKSVKKSMEKELYWINSLDEKNKFDDKLKKAKVEINSLLNEFEYKQEEFIQNIYTQIKDLFDMEYVILIEENQNILFKALQRKLYKKMPFQNNDKDCFADAIIIETLIEIESLINIRNEDEIFFISGNFKDFSSKENKKNLHKDIQIDLEKKGLTKKVKYENLLFKTLLEEFSKEIERAGIRESVEKQYLREQDEIFDKIISDDARERSGLPSLSTNFEEIISEKKEIVNFLNTIQEEMDIVSKVADEYISDFYNFEEKLERFRKQNLLHFINELNELEIFEENLMSEGLSKTELIYEIISNVNSYLLSMDQVENFKDSIYISDSFELGASLLIFKGWENEDFAIEVEGELEPVNNGIDIIEINFTENNTYLGRSYIHVDYGYANFEAYGELSNDSREEEIILENIGFISNVLNRKIREIKSTLYAQSNFLNQVEKIVS